MGVHFADLPATQGGRSGILTRYFLMKTLDDDQKAFLTIVSNGRPLVQAKEKENLRRSCALALAQGTKSFIALHIQ